MDLSWRDLVSSATAIVMTLAYASFAYGTRMPLLSTAWAASAVELVLGAICAVTAAIDLHTRPQPWPGVIFRRVTTVLGAIALVAGLAGLAADSAKAVEIVVVATAFLWLTGTTWHVLAIRSQPGQGRNNVQH
jgi:multisubunit Na+/H+ antiporter MnhG subunit